MSAALRLVDYDRSLVSTLSPAPLEAVRSSFRPTFRPSLRTTPLRPSLRPTLVPGSRATVIPSLTGSRPTEAPSTQRCATVHPRGDAAARQEASSLLAVLRMNVAFLESLLIGDASASARGTLDDVETTIDRLERCVATSPSIR